MKLHSQIHIIFFDKKHKNINSNVENMNKQINY